MSLYDPSSFGAANYNDLEKGQICVLNELQRTYTELLGDLENVVSIS